MNYSSLLKIIVNTLSLTKSDIEILKLLYSKKGGLLISDIIEKIKCSERNIRKRIKLLIEKGILTKRIEVLENKRLAYRYFIVNEKRIIEKTINNLNLKIMNLNNLLYDYNIKEKEI